MKVITMEQNIDETGILHLNIPVDVKSTRAEVIVIIKPKQVEKRKYDFLEFVGKLEWKGDTQEIARKMRSAWG